MATKKTKKKPAPKKKAKGRKKPKDLAGSLKARRSLTNEQIQALIHGETL